MTEQVELIVAGGMVSLVSSLLALLVQHLLGQRSSRRELRHSTRDFLIQKQIECYERFAPITWRVLEYACKTVSDEMNKRPDSRSEDRAQKTKDLMRELMECYYSARLILPAKVVEKIHDVYEAHIHWAEQANLDTAYKFMSSLSHLDEIVRSCLGVDQISADILAALRFREGENDDEELLKLLRSHNASEK